MLNVDILHKRSIQDPDSLQRFNSGIIIVFIGDDPYFLQERLKMKNPPMQKLRWV